MSTMKMTRGFKKSFKLKQLLAQIVRIKVESAARVEMS